MRPTNTAAQAHGNRKNFEKILRSSQLKVTQPRLRVLEIIEKILGSEIDRVTLYRILASFEEKGILHKVFDLNGTATYAICSTECSTDHHHDQHVHFICSVCNSVFCLNEIASPKIQLPPNFSLESISVNAVGICDKCQA
jgi:Fur family ferric uptake transcriptional regulator